MKKHNVFLALFLLVQACSTVSNVQLSQPKLPDWTIVKPTSWNDSSINVEGSGIELLQSSKIDNAHMSIATIPWSEKPSDFGPAMMMAVLDNGFTIIKGHSTIVDGTLGTYVQYTASSMPNVTIEQIAVGHGDHGHILACAFDESVSVSEQHNCRSSLNTFKMNH